MQALGEDGKTEQNSREEVRRWLAEVFKDPIVRVLLENSHFTRVQLETLLIDLLAEGVAGRPLSFEEKAQLRISRSRVSRGAFNRTLRQARRNTLRSLYTVLLLGYLGVLESPRLEPYMEIGSRLRNYVEAYRRARGQERRRILGALERELQESLRKLAEPRAISSRPEA